MKGTMKMMMMMAVLTSFLIMNAADAGVKKTLKKQDLIAIAGAGSSKLNNLDSHKGEKIGFLAKINRFFGVILLDGASDAELVFQKVSKKQSRVIGMSSSERSAYNEEIEEINAIRELVVDRITSFDPPPKGKAPSTFGKEPGTYGYEQNQMQQNTVNPFGKQPVPENERVGLTFEQKTEMSKKLWSEYTDYLSPEAEQGLKKVSDSIVVKINTLN